MIDETKLFVVTGFPNNNKFIRFKKPLILKGCKDQYSLFILEYKPLAINLYFEEGEEESDVYNDLNDYLGFAYENFALEDDANLTEDAREVKYKLIDMIEEKIYL